jgi:V8-like Glu-specific endopeptidase
MLAPSARRLGLASVAALACASALVPAVASAKVKAHAAAAGNGVVASAPQLSSAAVAAGKAKYGAHATVEQSLAAYWTPARMRAAKSIDTAPFLQTALQHYQLGQATKLRALQTQGAGGAQAPASGPQFSMKPDTTPKAAPKPLATAAAYNPNFNYWQPTAYTNGKVFFNMPDGGYQCSATIVNSEGQDTVWTAGHCVNQGVNGGAWATNWTFVPAYDTDLSNPAPYGYWSARQLWTRSGWANGQDFTQDMGVAIMNPQYGYKIVAYFGGQGFRVNAGKNVWENTFGYPAEYPFDGGHLMECWGTTSPETTILWWTSNTLKVPCDMTRGESGGPWLNGWDGNWGYLNGINSRIDRIVGPTVTFSPYFDDDALSLYNATRYL